MSDPAAAAAADPARLAARAQAHLKLGHWLEAADDARKACDWAPGMTEAWALRGTALFHLEEYEAAADAFARVLAAEPDNADAAVWARKCAAELEEEAGGGSGGAPTTITATPSAPPPPRPAFPVQWFQTADKVEVAVLAKKLAPDQVTVSISPDRLVVAVLPAVGGGGGGPSPPPLALDVALAAPIDPARSGWELLPTKVEVRLAKAGPPGVMWRALDAGGAHPAPGLLVVGGGGAAAAVPLCAAAPPPPAAPCCPGHAPPPAEKQASEPSPPRDTYPSSSAKPKDWAALEKAVEAEEAAAPPEGEAALTALFRTLYKDADDDTRRAMVKSYQESGGTVLSTNWDEVGRGAVEMKAPEGMEVKKYEY